VSHDGGGGGGGGGDDDGDDARTMRTTHKDTPTLQSIHAHTLEQ